MGNFSKDPKTELANAVNSGHVRVRFQQGKPVLDSELNLAADLASPQQLATGFIGNGVVGGDDFGIIEFGGGDFTIKRGHALVNGLGAVLLEDTKYQKQPVQRNVVPVGEDFPGPFVHLRVFTREVDSLEDRALANSGDVGFETSVRDKAEWEVLVSAAKDPGPDHLLLAEIDSSGKLSDRRRVGLKMASIIDRLDSVASIQKRLFDRVAASHDPSGALKPDTVDTEQLVDKSVTGEKLTESSVSIQHLKTTPVSGTVTVDLGTDASFVLSKLTLPEDDRAELPAEFILVSVATHSKGEVSWREFASTEVTGDGSSQFVRGLRIHYEGPEKSVIAHIAALRLSS